MRVIKVLLIALTISIVPVKKSEAAIGGVVALAGNPAVGGKVAIAGLGVFAGGTLLSIATGTSGGCEGGICIIPAFFGFLGGVILLDEETGSFEFSQLDNQAVKELGITEREAETYNSEIEEVNIIFAEVSGSLDEESSVEESKELWAEYSEFVSPETFQVMQKLASVKK